MDRIGFLRVRVFVETLVVSIIVNVLLSSMPFLDISGIFQLDRYSSLVVSLVFSYIISLCLHFLVKKLYTPGFFRKGKMTLKDVIKRNTFSGGKDMPIYTDREYFLRYERGYHIALAMVMGMIGLFFPIVLLIVALLGYPSYILITFDLYFKAVWYCVLFVVGLFFSLHAEYSWDTGTFRRARIEYGIVLLLLSYVVYDFVLHLILF